jgi:nucleoside-diphosphate kinase
MPIERTLILAKGDAVARGLTGEILGRFERRGFTIIGMKMLHVSPELARRHYAEHDGKPFFNGLVEYITSAPIVALVLEGNDVIEGARTSIGATNPIKAAPGSIRGDLAQTIGRNLVHGSDSAESSAREIAIWFQEHELFARPHHLAEWLISS